MFACSPQPSFPGCRQSDHSHVIHDVRSPPTCSLTWYITSVPHLHILVVGLAFVATYVAQLRSPRSCQTLWISQATFLLVSAHNLLTGATARMLSPFEINCRAENEIILSTTASLISIAHPHRWRTHQRRHRKIQLHLFRQAQCFPLTSRSRALLVSKASFILVVYQPK